MTTQQKLFKFQTMKRKFLDQIEVSTLAFEEPNDVDVLGWYQDKYGLAMYLYVDGKGKIWRRLTTDNRSYGQQIFID